jgi:hypothetical protein
MRRTSCDPQSHSVIDDARSLVLEWLREEQREPRFLMEPSQADLSGSHQQIADRFLYWIIRSGFDAQLVEIQQDGVAGFEVHWTHHGATFVGFKQAPPAEKPDDALLLGCAAFLKNDWCCRQLEQ